MPTLEDLTNELLAHVQDLPPLLAGKLVQRAWSEVRSRRHWSFLLADGQLFSPAEINTGTFSVTQFSATAQADADAITALASVSNPAITTRQSRFAGGPLYEISAYNPGTGAMTLNRIYREESNSSSTYSVYRAYYGPPLLDATGVEDTDFLRWVAITDPANSYWFTRLYGTRQELDLIDPQRASTGSFPFGMYSFKTNSSGVPRFEMWPHPVAERSYRAVYQKRGTNLEEGESLPPQIPEDLILTRALARACNWAKMNVGVYPTLRGVGWGDAAIEHQRNYLDLLKRAERDDEEAFLQYWLLRDMPAQAFPYDSNWLQYHDADLISMNIV
jgi:hypothetical protein